MELKLLEENVGKKIFNIGPGNDFGHDTRSTNDKNTKKQKGLHQTKKLLFSKTNTQQNAKAVY